MWASYIPESPEQQEVKSLELQTTSESVATSVPVNPWFLSRQFCCSVPNFGHHLMPGSSVPPIPAEAPPRHEDFGLEWAQHALKNLGRSNANITGL